MPPDDSVPVPDCTIVSVSVSEPPSLRSDTVPLAKGITAVVPLVADVAASPEIVGAASALHRRAWLQRRFRTDHHQLGVPAMKVNWGDIGSSQQPGEYAIHEQIVLVQRSEIAEWKSHPDAVFDVVDARFKDSDIWHVLDEIVQAGAEA